MRRMESPYVEGNFAGHDVRGGMVTRLLHCYAHGHKELADEIQKHVFEGPTRATWERMIDRGSSRVMYWDRFPEGVARTKGPVREGSVFDALRHLQCALGRLHHPGDYGEWCLQDEYARQLSL